MIAPFVKRCCKAISEGAPLPEAPVPPSGSSSALLRYARAVGCGDGSRGSQFKCMEERLNESLLALQPDPDLLEKNRTLLESRLREARRRGCRARNYIIPETPSCSVVPAAVGAHVGSLQLSAPSRGMMQLLRGGETGIAIDAGTQQHSGAPAADRRVEVPMIDLVEWVQRSFAREDYVVLKMDVEGAEAEIVPALLATNASQLIDVLLWECHLAVRGGTRGKAQCAAWEAALLANGVRRIYRDPYPFASASDSPAYRFRVGGARWRS